MGTYGPTGIYTGGRGVMVAADNTVHWKHGGVTIDWATVDAVSGSDETLDDDRVVKVGDKFLRYGTVLTRITSGGLYGPYDDDTPASDGRQNAGVGDTFVLNETVVMSDPGSSHPAVLQGGPIWGERVNLILGMTIAKLIAACPTFEIVDN